MGNANNSHVFSFFMGLKSGLIFSSLIGFFCFTFVSVFLLSSCGLAGGGSGFFEPSSVSGSGPGDGETPRLASRLQDDPDIADKECEDSESCQETCRYIYEDSDSYKDCYELTIKQVVVREEVFHALLGADTDELEDIEEDDLEDYLETGLDGWRDKVVEKQTARDDRDERFRNILRWIVDQENKVVSILQKEDRDNEILREIFLAYCHLGNDQCGNSEALSLGGGFGFDYGSGDISHNNTRIASIRDRENKDLLLALVSGGDVFFERAAGDRRFKAFVLGNDLVEKACTSRDRTSLNQCVAAFYCFVSSEISDSDHSFHSNKAQDFLINSEVEEGAGRVINLFECGASFEEIEN